MTAYTRLFLRYQLPVFSWAALIILVSSLPQPPRINDLAPGLDKVAHFFEYGILGYLVTRSLYHHTKPAVRARAIRIAVILGLVFAGMDEFHQLFIPGRYASLLDLAADTAGLLLAQVIFYILVIKRRIRQE